MVKYNDLIKIFDLGYTCYDRNYDFMNISHDNALRLLERLNPTVLEMDAGCHDYEWNFEFEIVLDLDKTDYGDMFGE